MDPVRASDLFCPEPITAQVHHGGAMVLTAGAATCRQRLWRKSQQRRS